MSDWRLHLIHDPKICHGQLTARGTRIPVTVILDSMAEGSSRELIISDYPTLTDDHLDAALSYAAELAREESLLPMSEL